MKRKILIANIYKNGNFAEVIEISDCQIRFFRKLQGWIFKLCSDIRDNISIELVEVTE